MFAYAIIAYDVQKETGIITSGYVRVTHSTQGGAHVRSVVGSAHQ